MKRFIALLVLLVYSVSVSAVSLNLHFCGDYLNHISLGNDRHGKCCCGDKPRKVNCCDDVKLEFSIKESHACGDVVHAPENGKFFLILFESSESLTGQFYPGYGIAAPPDTGPPEHYYSSSIFLRNNNLRI